MKKMFVPALAVMFATMASSAVADVVNLRCFGFPQSPWAMLGNNVTVDSDRHMVKSLDSGYQWITANFSGDTVQWVSRGSAGDGTAIVYSFSLDRAGLVLTQVVSANGRAVYTGMGQCSIAP